MTKREPQAGDFFLLPYAGPRRQRIIKAIRPHAHGGGHWIVSNEAGHSSLVLLSSCHRISPSEADRICKRGAYARPAPEAANSSPACAGRAPAPT